MAAIEILDDHCLEYIFGLFPPQHLLFYKRVCKRWNCVITALIRRYNFMRITNRDKVNIILKCIAACGHNLKVINLTYDLDVKIYKAIGRECTRLKALRFIPSRLEDGSQPLFQPHYSLRPLMENLEEIAFLTTFQKNAPYIQCGIVNMFLKECKKIKTYILVGKNEINFQHLILPSTITTLRICAYLGDHLLSLFENVARSCPNIEELSVPSIPNEGVYDALVDLGERCPKITHLKLAHSETTPLCYLQYFPNLKILHLHCQYSSVDSEELFPCIPNLVELMLVQCVGFDEIPNFKMLPKLKILKVIFEYNPESIDDWLKSLDSLEMLVLKINYSVNGINRFTKLIEIIQALPKLRFINISKLFYDHYMYKKLREITIHRKRKLKIKMRNDFNTPIPRCTDDNFIIEERL